MLDELKSNKKVVGFKEVTRELNEGNVSLVYLAEDVEEDLKEEVKNLCQDNEVEIFYVESMEVLGKACEIDVNAATAALII